MNKGILTFFDEEGKGFKITLTPIEGKEPRFKAEVEFVGEKEKDGSDVAGVHMMFALDTIMRMKADKDMFDVELVNFVIADMSEGNAEPIEGLENMSPAMVAMMMKGPRGEA